MGEFSGQRFNSSHFPKWSKKGDARPFWGWYASPHQGCLSLQKKESTCRIDARRELVCPWRLCVFHYIVRGVNARYPCYGIVCCRRGAHATTQQGRPAIDIALCRHDVSFQMALTWRCKAVIDPLYHRGRSDCCPSYTSFA